MDKRGIVTSDLHISILEALGEAGIEIPFPQRDMRLRSVDKSGIEIDKVAGTN
jgi:small-conductance mechanosensitive channel